MRKLLVAASVLALLGGSAHAQQTATSGSNSGASSGSLSSANNGGQTIGPQTATSDSASGAVSGSTSISQGGAGGTGQASATASTGASTSSSTTGASTATNSTTANPTADNAGNAQSITFNTTNPDRVKTVPQVYAPGLTTTLTETCMGSTTGGVSVLGFGGTLGTTWNDGQCVRRLNAREMAQTLGDRDAARALLCQDKDVAAAYAAIGQDCHKPVVVPVVVANQYAPVAVPPPAPVLPPPPVTMKPIPNPEERGERGTE